MKMNKKYITSKDKALSYMGRIDFKGEYPLLIYAGSNIKTKFTGTSVSVEIIPELIYEKSWLGAVIDGVQYCYELSQKDEKIILELASGLEDKEHTLTIFKRTAGSHYYLRFCGLYIDENAEVMPTDEKYNLKLEVYGDSVSAGEVVEAVYYTGCSDPSHHSQYDNAWFSYPCALSRKLGAELNSVAQGGIALFDKTGYFDGPDYVGMETVYNKLSYVPCKGYTEWDFSEYPPDIVIIAIGQNDAHPDPDAIRNPEYRTRWKEKYKSIINELMEHYGDNTKFILTMTLLMHDFEWDTVLDEVRDEMNDKNVMRFRFTRNGLATPGHPRIPEQEEMAGELAQFIRQKLL